jgi:hypothetical protein
LIKEPTLEELSTKPVLNNKYYILGSLGSSKTGTSKVYLAQEIDKP